ncbi:MAG: glycosyltransferase family 1 protein [Anaerolineales bacterium]|nr:glycosyltransferase family 1 protein [Anaerolineales bacterium]
MPETMSQQQHAMKVVLLTYGSRGDVEPFLALAEGLMRAGHAARVVAPGVFEDLAKKRRIPFFPLPGNPDRLVRDLVQEAGGNPILMVKVVSRFVLPLAADVMRTAMRACADSDVIVHSFLMTNAGHEIAIKQRIPDFSAQFFPVFLPTEEFPGVVAPDLPLGAAYRRITHRLIRQVFMRGSSLLYGRLRKGHPELPPLTGWPLDERRPRFPGDRDPTPVLYAYSPHVLPAPQDWPVWAHVTGYWAPQIPEGARGPEELEAFLQAGPPPVYIGFGSVISRDPARLTRIAIEALRISGQRGVISTSDAGLPGGSLPDHVCIAGDVPHGWLFPRMAAAVHHGGAGTTGASLRAGLPTLVVPFTSDQPFWGRQVSKLGVGPTPMHPRRLTAARLAEGIQQMLSDTDMRGRARLLGEQIRAEDGVGCAVARIEQGCGVVSAVG